METWRIKPKLTHNLICSSRYTLTSTGGLFTFIPHTIDGKVQSSTSAPNIRNSSLHLLQCVMGGLSARRLIKHDRQYTCSMILRRVRVTFLSWRSNKYDIHVFRKCFCSLIYPAFKVHAL